MTALHDGEQQTSCVIYMSKNLCSHMWRLWNKFMPHLS